MANVAPQFETSESLGSTAHYNGTVGTTAVSVPAVAGNAIADVMISNLDSNANSKKLLVSFDGGTNFTTLSAGASLPWTVRGGITQIKVKGSVASVAYEILMNLQP